MFRNRTTRWALSRIWTPAKLDEAWTAVDFDDSGWDEARPLVSGGGGPEATYGGLLQRPFRTLLPRGIAMLEERLETAKRIVWVKGLQPDSDLDFWRRSYEEPLVEAPRQRGHTPDDLLKLEAARRWCAPRPLATFPSCSTSAAS